jgi:signal transduction histidine kinase
MPEVNDQQVFEAAFKRERLARMEAERILEDKTRELYILNEALRAANESQKLQQEQLVQTEKLASIGSLAAGIAHEINNPLAFVISNINALNKYSEQYLGLVSLLVAIDEKLPDPVLQYLESMQSERRDIGYIVNDTRLIFTEVKDGLERVRDIVASLKTFARTNPGVRSFADLNQAMTESLKILDNELKYKCEVNCQLRPLPPIYCNIGEVGQVFINIIINACHSIRENGVINISSEVDHGVRFIIEDNGCGIPEDILSKIFDPFFTSKPLGEGTGIGLSVSHGIVETMGGHIHVESEVGKGTRFTLCFPLEKRELKP